MRIGVISDIHGNCVALAAVLSDSRKAGIDKLVCLGDAIQGGPQPAETVRSLREQGCPIVMGNADAWLLDVKGDTKEKTSTQQREVRRWTISKLSSDDLAFMRGFKPTVNVDLGGRKRLLCFHGSPSSYDDVLLPETPERVWERLLGQADADLLAGGHTHAQQLRHVGEKTFFNPGSVGLVYDVRMPGGKIHAYPHAEYAIVEASRRRSTLEFRRVPYDVDKLFRAVKQGRRPHGDELIAEYTEK